MTGISIGSDSRPSIHYTANSNLYYVLLRGSALTNITQPVKAQLFGGTNATLIDPPFVSSAQTAFYKVQGVLRETPLDLDGDGLNDAYELLRPLYLDPLNPKYGP